MASALIFGTTSPARVVITYDLNHNDISAQEIADASNGQFEIIMFMPGAGNLKLSNTTLISKKWMTADQAVTAFKQSFIAARSCRNKPYCQISRILMFDVVSKNGYIENN